MGQCTKIFVFILILQFGFSSCAFSSGLYSVTKKEIELYKEYFLPKNIIVDSRQIKKNIEQNKKLSKKYKKTFGINKVLDQMILDKFYANLFLKKMKDKFNVDDKSIKSYFLIHKNEFIKDDYIDFILYELDFSGSIKYIYNYDFVDMSTLPNILQIQLRFLKDGEESKVFYCCGTKYKVKLVKKYKKKDLGYSNFSQIIKRILIEKNYKKFVESIIDN